MKNLLKEFVDYTFGFYGPNEMYAHYFTTPVTKAEIKAATLIRIKTGQFEGDSFDREAVRDIMLSARGNFVKSL